MYFTYQLLWLEASTMDKAILRWAVPLSIGIINHATLYKNEGIPVSFHCPLLFQTKMRQCVPDGFLNTFLMPMISYSCALARGKVSIYKLVVNHVFASVLSY